MGSLVLQTAVLALTLLCNLAFAQDQPSISILDLPIPLPPGVGMQPGAPYSATEEFEEAQTFADGTRIVHQTASKIYRDFQGRLRLEVFLGRELSEGPRMISILDPVAGVQYSLSVDTRIATRRAMARPAPLVTPLPKRLNLPSRLVQSARTQLGSQMIEGFSTEGVRMESTVPTGTVGNDRPLTTLTEVWYSDELKLVLLTKRSDPRSTTVNRLTNISRVEPSAALFEVPPDYTIEEAR